MAINFPTNPNNGDVHAGFTYNSTKGVWESVAPSMMPTSDTPPTSPSDGQMWFDTDGGGAFVYYEDTDSAQWVEVIGSAGADGAAGPAGADGSAAVYATVDDLPGTASAGDQAFVTASNRLYLWNGSGWYNIALINTTPSISGAASSYALATDGTPTVVTITATDPEGLPITYSIASDTSGNIATVTSNNNVFTITPSTNTADAGSFSLTFRASDGVNIASAISSFTLQFKVVNSNYTTALITSVGTNNATNSTFVDSSTNSHTITAASNATQTTFSPYRHGGYSTYFDGAGDYIETTLNSNFSSKSYTIEGWFYPSINLTGRYSLFNVGSGTSSTDRITIGVYDGTFFHQHELGNINQITVLSGGIGNYTLTSGQWHHFEMVFDWGGAYDSTSTGYIFMNGVLQETYRLSGHVATSIVELSRSDIAGGAKYFPGYISDFRVRQGIAAHTANFTPPTERLTAITNTSLLTCHLPYIADGSTNGHTITINGNTKTEPFSPYDYATYSAGANGGSMYFDGNGDYLLSTGQSFGTGDFAVEAWLYPTAVGSSDKCWFDSRDTAGSNGMVLFIDTSGLLSCYSSSSIRLTSSKALKPNTWSHVAFVRNNGTIYWFIDGSLSNSTSYSSIIAAPGGFKIGARNDTAANFIGYISNFRAVIGTAVYTSDFTPPTTPLTAITNTSLLLSGTNAGIIDKSQTAKTLTLNGDVKSSTTQTKYLSSSMAFDGTGDRIEVANSTELQMGTGDFTFEWWWYPTAAAIMRPICINGTGAGSWSIIMYANQTFDLAFATSPVFSSAVSYSINTWEHIAIVRENGTVTCYVDGISQQSATNTTNLNATTVLGIGYDTAASSQAYQGYMSDVRITKGLARYTSNFTPPTAALEG